MRYEYCVIGGGIVGLASALALLELRPGISLVLLEKEGELGRHQTGHNSGVVHSGVYYAPGSLKARLCREGSEWVRGFAADQGVPFETTGKLIVARSADEMKGLSDIAQRAGENGVAVERLGRHDIEALEPNITGAAAILVPSTAITDFIRLAEAMADKIRSLGGEIRLGAEVSAVRETSSAVAIRLADANTLQAGRLIACAGLQSDRIARLAGLQIDSAIVPFRGEYYALRVGRRAIIQRQIYPVPDPRYPFLGIHLTRMIDGEVRLGPNAVLAFARETYRRAGFSLSDLGDLFRFSGFGPMVRQHWQSGLGEMRRSMIRRLYLAECQSYCPGLTLEDLAGFRMGIRAQAVMPDGSLAHDFLVQSTNRMTHVLNAPSPAATSAMPIGRMIAKKAYAQA
jgi:L-2-hydroxyglutarate oxidase